MWCGGSFFSFSLSAFSLFHFAALNPKLNKIKGVSGSLSVWDCSSFELKSNFSVEKYFIRLFAYLLFIYYLFIYSLKFIKYNHCNEDLFLTIKVSCFPSRSDCKQIELLGHER